MRTTDALLGRSLVNAEHSKVGQVWALLLALLRNAFRYAGCSSGDPRSALLHQQGRVCRHRNCLRRSSSQENSSRWCSNRSGATGVIIMYTAGESYRLLPGCSNYWMGLDVEGFDPPGGGKARWMLTGLYSPGSVAAALAKYFNYPTREGSTRLERDGRRVVVVGSMGGQEMVQYELVLKAEPCQRVWE